MRPKPDRKLVLAGLAVFVVCLLVRLVGIQWGLPTQERVHALHPDEEVVWAYSQQIQPAKGDFTPGFYNYGTLFLTLEKIATDVVNGYGGGPQKQDGSDSHLAVARYLLAGRLMSSVAGSLTAVLVFLILVRRTSLVGAVIGAAATGLTPALVVHSRFATVDVLATCFLVASFYFSLRLVPSQEGGSSTVPALRTAVWAGVMAGLSAGTKYTGLFALVVLFVVVVAEHLPQKAWKDAARLCLAGLAACLATFLVVTPGAILETSKFVTDFKYEMTHTQQGHGLVFAGTASGFAYHLGNLIVGYGGLLLALSIVGLVWACARKHSWAIALAAFFALSYLLIGRAEVKFIRYTFPLVPVLATGFGWWMGQGHLRRDAKGRIAVALGVVAIGGVGGGAANTAALTTFMVKPPVQDQAADFLKQVAAPGETVGLVADPWFYTPTLYPQAQAGPMFDPQYRLRPEWMAAAQNPSVTRFTPQNPVERFDWDSRLLTESAPDYVVFSSYEVEGLERLERAKAVPDQFKLQFDRYKAFLTLLREDYETIPAKDASGKEVVLFGLDGAQPTNRIHDLSYIRPIIWIWKRKTDSRQPSSGSSTTSGQSEGQAPTR